MVASVSGAVWGWTETAGTTLSPLRRSKRWAEANKSTRHRTECRRVRSDPSGWAGRFMLYTHIAIQQNRAAHGTSGASSYHTHGYGSCLVPRQDVLLQPHASHAREADHEAHQRHVGAVGSSTSRPSDRPTDTAPNKGPRLCCDAATNERRHRLSRSNNTLKDPIKLDSDLEPIWSRFGANALPNQSVSPSRSKKNPGHLASF